MQLAGATRRGINVVGGDRDSLRFAVNDRPGELGLQGDEKLARQRWGTAILAFGDRRELGLKEQVGGLLRPEHAGSLAVDEGELAVLMLLTDDASALWIE